MNIKPHSENIIQKWIRILELIAQKTSSHWWLRVNGILFP